MDFDLIFLFIRFRNEMKNIFLFFDRVKVQIWIMTVMKMMFHFEWHFAKKERLQCIYGEFDSNCSSFPAFIGIDWKLNIQMKVKKRGFSNPKLLYTITIGISCRRWSRVQKWHNKCRMFIHLGLVYWWLGHLLDIFICKNL